MELSTLAATGLAVVLDVRDASGCLVVGALAVAGALAAAGALVTIAALIGTTESTAGSGTGFMLSSDGSSGWGRRALRGEVLGLELHHGMAISIPPLEGRGTVR